MQTFFCTLVEVEEVKKVAKERMLFLLTLVKRGKNVLNSSFLKNEPGKSVPCQKLELKPDVIIRSFFPFLLKKYLFSIFLQLESYWES